MDKVFRNEELDGLRCAPPILPSSIQTIMQTSPTMKNNYEFTNGLRNINDASFMREKFIPIAMAGEKWNLVVSESHRTVELLLGGLIFLLGGDPCQKKHNLEGLVEKFEKFLIESKENLPFSIGYYSESGNCYGIGLKNNSVSVYKKINNLYTLMGSVSCNPEFLEKNTKIDLEVDESGAVTLLIDDKAMLKHPGASLGGSQIIRIRRQFNIKPRSLRFLEMKKIGQCFTHALLLDARYSKREFSETEALDAKRNMERIFEMSENFVFIGKSQS